MLRAEAYSAHDRMLAYLRSQQAATEEPGTLESAGETADDQVQIAIAVEELGNGESRVVLRVQTDNEATWRAIEEMRASGVVPKEAAVEFIGPMVGLGPADAVSPVQPGVACAHEIGLPGTLGFFAQRDGASFLVSANHVIARENRGTMGADAIVQPLTGAAGVRSIGVLHDFEPLRLTGGNAMDGAIASVTIDDTDPMVFNGRRIRDARTLPLLKDDRVFKFGCISRETSGAVLSTISNVTLTMRRGSYRFDLHIEVASPAEAPFSVSGDSGALVYDQNDQAVGILIGGNQSTRSIVTPIDRILGRFHLTLA